MSAAQALKLYTAQQSRDVDRCAIAEHGLAGPLLMARAARAAFRLLLEKNPAPELVQILCGPGNNGGDGLLLGMLLQGRGVPVRLFLVAGEPRSEDAALAAERARAAGLKIEAFEPQALEPRGLIVDAMLGTGIAGAPREPFGAAIEAVNVASCAVLALDVPSGVNSDTGHAAGPAVRADWTISFITAKRGLHTGTGEGYGGECYLDDLDVPEDAYVAAGDACETLDLEVLRGLLPQRSSASHKGDFGRVLLLGGERGMGGAIILAAEAALRTGVGLARVGTREEHLAPLLARRPECMATAVSHRNDLDTLLPWADAVVLGPGLGRQPWAEQLLQVALASGKPLVVDADGLNLLADGGIRALPDNSLITPHPGEAGRLLGCTTADVQADRFSAAVQLAERFATTVILKGNGSIVADNTKLALCRAGNAGMASGGMGDVLSGIAGALLAQGLKAWDAARLGTELHSAAADLALQYHGSRSLLAADLMDHLGDLIP